MFGAIWFWETQRIRELNGYSRRIGKGSLVFGISMYELGLIALVGLIFLGPRQLAETAKVVGRMIRELQRMATDVQRTINLDLDSPPASHSTYNQDRSLNPVSSGTPSKSDEDLILPKGEKSGPDFYAELLANSAEVEKKDKDDSTTIEEKPTEENTGEKHKEINV
ncbi:MAG: twin-arginine translocase TatA/TatE family subunit [Pseudomonadota bacterium]